MAKYYFTPTVQNTDNGNYEPAEDDGGAISSVLGELVGGIDGLKLDKAVPRYVLSCPDGMDAFPGWEEKTKEEVNTAYPGLIQ